MENKITYIILAVWSVLAVLSFAGTFYIPFTMMLWKAIGWVFGGLNLMTIIAFIPLIVRNIQNGRRK